MRQKSVKAYFPKTSARLLGVAHIVLGIASICLTVALPLVIGANFAYSNASPITWLAATSVATIVYFTSGLIGLWGITAIITGVLSIMASSKRTTSQITAYMVMAILTCFFAGIDFIITVIFSVYYCDAVACFQEGTSFTAVIIAMAIASGLEMLIAFWSSAMSSRFVCSRGCKKYCCTCYSNPEVDNGDRSIEIRTDSSGKYTVSNLPPIKAQKASNYGYGNPLMMNGYSTMPTNGYGYGGATYGYGDAYSMPMNGYSSGFASAAMPVGGYGYSTMPVSSPMTMGGYPGNFNGMPAARFY